MMMSCKMIMRMARTTSVAPRMNPNASSGPGSRQVSPAKIPCATRQQDERSKPPGCSREEKHEQQCKAEHPGGADECLPRAGGDIRFPGRPPDHSLLEIPEDCHCGYIDDQRDDEQDNSNPNRAL